MRGIAGMAGNQVLEWFDIDSEVKTANLKDVSCQPPPAHLSAMLSVCVRRTLWRPPICSSARTSGEQRRSILSEHADANGNGNATSHNWRIGESLRAESLRSDS